MGDMYIVKADTGKRVTPSRYEVSETYTGTPGELVRYGGSKLQIRTPKAVYTGFFLRRMADGKYIVVNVGANQYLRVTDQQGASVTSIPEIEKKKV